MKKTLRVALGICALAGFAAVDDAWAACSRVSAQGEGLTKELATEMAKINLSFSISAKNAKATGPVRVSCAPGMMILTACKAQQRACS